MKDKINDIKNSMVQTISQLNVSENLVDIVMDELYFTVHNNQGKIITMGMGKAGIVAKYTAHTFSATGSPAVFVHPSEAQHGDLGMIQEKDIIILYSNSGQTTEINEIITLIRILHNNLIILITNSTDSFLVDVCDYVFAYDYSKEIDHLELVPTNSYLAMTCISQILITLLMERINFTYEEFHKRHHSGYLGEQSRNKQNDTI